MALAKNGDKVKIDYTGKLEDGTIFDSTLEDLCDSDECDSDDCDDECGDDECGCGGHDVGPMELTIGEGELFSQVDEALIGMAPGDKKSVVIPAVDGFGEYDKDKVFTVPRSDLPDDMQPEVGDEMVLTNEDDEELGVQVVEATADSVTFDSNHPLAGEELTFEITLLEIL
ncbi:MAG: peptidylprolyl isomerase [Desulfuromonadales bacterium]|nr:peptidylprolyl isomerase [Desulfuromonadales bacterium]